MKLQFDSHQDFQIQAIQSVVDIFEGQPLNTGDYEFSLQQGDTSLAFTENGVGNAIRLTEQEILKNVHSIQKRNGIEESSELKGLNFSVEMETGTGKTYVYLRTIYELNKTYGFKKFIIVVPSIAIREGVLKNLQITYGHFQSLYNRAPLTYTVYGSKNVSALRGFALSNTIQVLVINIDSFAKDENIINKPNDKLTGKRPIEFIQYTNPIVIVDEPQNMETDLRKEAIANLKPSCTLRYSATHRDVYNLVYKLSPVKAYDLGLVKQIEVDSVVSEDSFNQAFVKLEGIKTQKKRPPRAKLSFDYEGAESVLRKSAYLDNGDNLYDLSNKREMYRDGYIVNSIDADEGFVEFSGGLRISLGETTGGLRDDIMKVQIRKTVEEHFRKEAVLRPKGIKVLSLLFIDKVNNYRLYEDGKKGDGKFAVWFEEIFKEYAGKPEFRGVIPFGAAQVHNGYFAQDKKGLMKDSREGKTSETDTEAYELIMKDKEKLLEINEPLRFIFSHSALREGWDNPNVFQLCTLNETTSELKKRQEIGRGLRLAVNSDGNRVFEKAVNRLTVIANESYEQFAKKLQKEIEDETGEKFEGRIKNKNEKKKVTLRKGYDADPKFIELWERIRQKTTYRVEYLTDELTRKAAKRVSKMCEILAPRIVAQRTKLVMEKSGVTGEGKSIEFHAPEYGTVAIPDIVGYIEQRTHLTRSTIMEILRQSGRLLDCLKNPQLFLESTVHEIKTELEATMVDGVKYQKIENEYYEMHQFQTDEIEEYLSNLYGVKNKEKTIFDNIEIDSLSETERKFANACDTSDDVEFFLKLPRWFEIETPVGKYRPDWALMLKKEKRLYFVAETKSTLDKSKRLESENQKIECGKKHFAELKEVYFTEATKLEDVEREASQIK
ncbi:MAG TPA: DEAD/DEAH box helicase family protein [Candidatus Acidoferrales bacterium]|nr:DEAD/DEAH box helicase family protein [Candidatus Acidoferrales bacterium]